MKNHLFFLSVLLLILSGRHTEKDKNDIEKWKSEIREAEKAFNDMAQKYGLIKAFEYYSAEDGVIRRNKKIISGKTAITKWYKNDVKPNETLTWSPTFLM